MLLEKARKKLREEKGVTMVALVITIIVLLILAGITIGIAVNNNNGIINRTNETKFKSELSELKKAVDEKIIAGETIKLQSSGLDSDIISDALEKIDLDADLENVLSTGLEIQDEELVYSSDIGLSDDEKSWLEDVGIKEEAVPQDGEYNLTFSATDGKGTTDWTDKAEIKISDKDGKTANIQYFLSKEISSISEAQKLLPGEWLTYSDDDDGVMVDHKAYIFAKVVDDDGRTISDIFTFDGTDGDSTDEGDGEELKIDTESPTIEFINNGDTTTWRRWNRADIKVTDDSGEVSVIKYKWLESGIEGKYDKDAWTDSLEIRDVTGKYKLWVYAEDNLGNSTTVCSDEFYIDNTAPTAPTNISFKTEDGNEYTPGTWTNQSVTVTISGGTDEHSGVYGYKYSLDSGETWIDIKDNNNGVATITFSDEMNKNTIKFSTVDNAKVGPDDDGYPDKNDGNISNGTDDNYWIAIDKTEPNDMTATPSLATYIIPNTGKDMQVNIKFKTAKTEDPKNSDGTASGVKSGTLYYTITNEKADVEYIEGDSNWRSFKSGDDLDNINGMIQEEGEYYFHIRFCDNAGNEKYQKNIGPYTVVKPEDAVTISHSPQDWTQSVNINVKFEDYITKNKKYGYGTTQKEAKSNSSNLDNSVFEYTSTVVNNGYVYVKLGDAAGNTAEITNYQVQNIDKLSPTVLLSYNIVEQYKKIKLTATATDGVATSTDGCSGISAYMFTKDNTKPDVNSDSWIDAGEQKGNQEATFESQEITENGTWYFWTKDQAGNINAENEGNSIEIDDKIIDNTAPVMNIEAYLNDASGEAYDSNWTNQNVYVKLTGTDVNGIARYEWYENESWTTRALNTANNVGEITYTADINTTIRFRAIDVAGNISEEKTLVVKIDKVNPNITFTPEEKRTYAKSQSVTINITDSNSGAKNGEKLNYAWSESKTIEPTEWKESTDVVTDNSITITESTLTGKYYLWVKGIKDNAGNVLPITNSGKMTSTTDNFTGQYYFDNSAPVIESIVPEQVNTPAQTHKVKPTIVDISKVTYYYGWSTSANTLPTTWKKSENGKTTERTTPSSSGQWYFWIAGLVDELGNETPSKDGATGNRESIKVVKDNNTETVNNILINKVTGPYNVDVTSPNVTFNPNVHGEYQQEDYIEVSFTDDNGMVANQTVQYAWQTTNQSEDLSGATWNNITLDNDDKIQVPVIEGKNYLWVKGAKDTLGNTITPVWGGQYKVDNTAPTVNLTLESGNVIKVKITDNLSKPDDYIITTDETFIPTGDSQEWVDCDENGSETVDITYTAEENGTYYVWAKDAAGNISEMSDSSKTNIQYKYTIEYYANNPDGTTVTGEVSPYTQEIVYYEYNTKWEDLISNRYEIEDYIFEYWILEGTSISYDNNSEVNANLEDVAKANNNVVKLYAQWIEAKNSIKMELYKDTELTVPYDQDWTNTNVYHKVTSEGPYTIAGYKYAHSEETPDDNWRNITEAGFNLQMSGNNATYRIDWSGEWVFYVKGVDSSGKCITNIEKFNIRIDKINPSINNINVDYSTEGTNKIVNLTVTANDPYSTGDWDEKDKCSGIKYYAITSSNTAPTEWEELQDVVENNNEDITINTEMENVSTGTYYFWVKDQAGNTCSQTFDIDLTAPTLTNTRIDVTSPDSGIYGKGQEITFVATFSENIKGTVPNLTIKYGDGAQRTISSGTISGATVTYKDSIKAGDNGILSLVSYSGGEITDIVGNIFIVPSGITLGGNEITADTEAPTVSFNPNGGTAITSEGGTARIYTNVTMEDNTISGIDLSKTNYVWVGPFESEQGDNSLSILDDVASTGSVMEANMNIWKVDCTKGYYYLFVDVFDICGNEYVVHSNAFYIKELIIGDKENSDLSIKLSNEKDDGEQKWTNQDVTATITYSDNTNDYTRSVTCEGGNDGTDYTIESTKKVIIVNNNITVNAKLTDSFGNSVSTSKKESKIDKTPPSANINPNGGVIIMPSEGNAKIETTVTTSDNEGGSGVSNRKCAWSTSNTEEPTTWLEFQEGIEASNACNKEGNYYLWTEITDKAENVSIEVSDVFEVISNTGLINITLSNEVDGVEQWTNQDVIATITYDSRLYIDRGACFNVDEAEAINSASSADNVTNIIVENNGYVAARAKDVLGNEVIVSKQISKIDKELPEIFIDRNTINEDTYYKSDNLKNKIFIRVYEFGESGCAYTKNNENMATYKWIKEGSESPTTEEMQKSDFVVSGEYLSNIPKDTGIYYFYVYTKDNAGNETLICSRKVCIDNTPPEIIISGVQNENGAYISDVKVSLKDEHSGIDNSKCIHIAGLNNDIRKDIDLGDYIGIDYNDGEYEITGKDALGNTSDSVSIELASSKDIPISTQQQLSYVGNKDHREMANGYRCTFGNTSEYTYNLQNDIALEGNWTPINVDFGAIFDGNNNTISNLNIEIDNSMTQVGLFKQIASSGEVKNLTITDASIELPSSNIFSDGQKLQSGTIAGYNERNNRKCKC